MAPRKKAKRKPRAKKAPAPDVFKRPEEIAQEKRAALPQMQPLFFGEMGRYGERTVYPPGTTWTPSDTKPQIAHAHWYNPPEIGVRAGDRVAGFAIIGACLAMFFVLPFLAMALVAIKEMLG